MVLLDLDLAKAFDRIPRELSFRLLQHMGLAKGVLTALKGWHQDAAFRYKFRSGYGGTWQTTNGFPQGCALSCIIMNALVATWIATLRAAALPMGVRLHLAAYADDQKATLLNCGSLNKPCKRWP